VLIVASVYLAVFLESSNQQRQDHAAARAALSQLHSELRQDLADFERIIGVQQSRTPDYESLSRWLSDPASSPRDSIGAAIFRIATDNATLFARRASWTTMVSAGQLADLDAPELVLQLGQLYETIYNRIDYNSRFYDEELNEALRGTTAIKWSGLPADPLHPETSEIRRLAEELERIHIVWNIWYTDLLGSYVDDVAAAIAAVGLYLGGS
jgi:hypothetical protein